MKRVVENRQSPEKVTLLRTALPRTRGSDFQRDSAEGPGQPNALERYLESPLRLQWLRRLAELTGENKDTPPLTNPDGCKLLTPLWTRNFLALEVYLRAGTTSEAVTCCTLGQFRHLLDEFDERRGPDTLSDKDEYHWLAALENPRDTEVLRAGGAVVRAIFKYVQYLRPSFFRGRCLPSSERLPLFPLEGGHRMTGLLPSMNLLHKVAGAKPDGFELGRDNVDPFKERMVQDLVLKGQL
jgi:hypothetical protein